MICQIQQLLKESCSYREIARRMGVGRNTIAKYRTGEPRELSMYGIHQSKLDIYHDFILECLYSGKSKSKTVKAIYAKGYTGSKSNAFDYLVKIEQCEGKAFELHISGHKQRHLNIEQEVKENQQIISQEKAYLDICGWI